MLVTKNYHNRVVDVLKARVKELEDIEKANYLRGQKLTNQYNDLARQFNTLRALVDSGAMLKPEFTPTEIESLVRLCHPDKHNGSASANNMTAKLLTLRNKK